MQLFRKTSLSRPEGEAGKTWPAIAMGFFVAFGGVLFGYDTGRIRRLPSDHPALEAELAEIQASYNYEKSLGEASWLDCFRPPLLKRQCTGMAIQVLQQLSSELHFYYCTKYFQNSGISSGFVISMITSAINVASTIPGMYTIDRWGRRPLLLWNTRL
ncbi:High-affinity glucose transporter RGT2 [Fusarium odoratissimum]|uniref:High-affinity glucose transporter RGT2 n=1 Tax=Fusarium oxysporum f. sp. cubense (strain race 4) TaxID=2502994 RepID=N1RV59_FUSC4|nr:High-affinity glucose transporter RGT2 [Fusarium odoratissimum]